MMDYLARGDAPFTEELWGKIDENVTGAAKESLVGRRMIPLYGPVGGGLNYASIDSPDKEEVLDDGVSVVKGRQLVQIPQLFEDFWLSWRDLEHAKQYGLPVDLSGALGAARKLANKEDNMIFYGLPKLGIPGLFTAEGALQVKQSDWSKNENAFKDLVGAVAALRQAGKLGKYNILVSLDLYVQLQRIVPGMGILESERIEKLVDGKLYYSNVLQPKTAAVVCSSARYMDLLIGQDIRTAYTEAVDLNHHLRIMETAVFRLKDPGAVAVIV